MSVPTDREKPLDVEREADRLRRELDTVVELRAQYRQADAAVPPALLRQHYELRRAVADEALRRKQSSSEAALPRVFAIMPFSEPFDDYYAQIIKPAVLDAGMEIVRSDEIYSPNAFVQTIWEQVLSADAVVAEMTGANPNVLYELGLSHAAGKTVVMITQAMPDVPADLRHINCIVYDTASVNWAESLRTDLQRMLLFAPRPGSKPVLDPPASVADTALFDQLVEDAEEQRMLAHELDAKLRDTAATAAALAAERDTLQVAVSRVLTAPGTAAVFERTEAGVTSAVMPLPAGDQVIEFVKVPAGPFILAAGERAERAELPTYWISRFSVTNAQYCAFLTACGNQVEGGSPWIDLEGSSSADRCRIVFANGRFQVEEGFEDHPATYVDFYGAAAFCAWVGGALPTVERWEKAVRGPDGHPYPWGDAPPTPEVANIGEDGWARDVAPIPVHHKAAGQSPYGVVQGLGNVWHWTSTYIPDRDVQAVRGGAFFDYRLGRRDVYRFLVHPDGPDFSQGFLVTRRFLPARRELDRHNVH